MHPGIAPNVCTEVSPKDREYLTFNPSEVINNLFREFQVQSTWVWAMYPVPDYGSAGPAAYRAVFQSENQSFFK